jgi:hypothetical protein
VLPWDRLMDEEQKLAQCYHYQISPTARELMNIFQAQKTLSGTPIRMT